MRIISGKLGGRKLKSFQAPHIRPTTDRVKESIFNKLSSYWQEARVLDLYSGTGNLSFEAHSWGAEYVLAVESHNKSLKIISENQKALGIGKEVQVRRADVLQFLKNYKENPFDVILIDPPFTLQLAHPTMEAVAQSGVWHKDSVIVIESSAQERMDGVYGDLKRTSQKSFGDKSLSFFSFS